MHVRYVRPVAAPAEKTWERLADLGALAEWLPTIAASPADPLRVGAVREARLKRPAFGKDVLVERVVRVGERDFTYEIEGGIGPLRPIVTTWRVGVEADRTRLEVESDLEARGPYRLMGPLVRASWRKRLAAMADALAADVEARISRAG